MPVDRTKRPRRFASGAGLALVLAALLAPSVAGADVWSFVTYFKPGSPQPTPWVREVLEQFCNWYSVVHLRRGFEGVLIVGHTDSMPDKAASLAISQQRAEAVVATVVKCGVPRAAITVRAVGDTEPLARSGRGDLNDAVSLEGIWAPGLDPTKPPEKLSPLP